MKSKNVTSNGASNRETSVKIAFAILKPESEIAKAERLVDFYFLFNPFQLKRGKKKKKKKKRINYDGPKFFVIFGMSILSAAVNTIGNKTYFSILSNQILIFSNHVTFAFAN